MKIYNQILWCFCVIVERDDFFVYALNTETDYIFKSSNPNEIRNFFLDRDEKIMCGYNNIHYDNPLINFILSKNDYHNIINEINYWNDIILNGNPEEWKHLKYIDYFNTLDMKKIVNLSDNTSFTDIKSIIKYKDISIYDDIDKNAKNNLLAIKKLLYLYQDSIKYRIYIENRFNVNIMNKDIGGIGVEIFKSLYQKKNNIIISKNNIPKQRSFAVSKLISYRQFNDANINSLCYKILNDTIGQNKKTQKYKFNICGTNVITSVGSLHGALKNFTYNANDNYKIISIDFISAYPNQIISKSIYPNRYNKEFISCIKDILNERMVAKSKGIKTLDSILKMSLNSIIGHLDVAGHWLYDQESFWKIKLNCQFDLLALIDSIENYIYKLIQINTDGFIFIAKNDLYDKIVDVIKSFEDNHHIPIAMKEYKSIYQIDINNYFALGDIVDRKGVFSKNANETLSDICIEAIDKRLIENIPVALTIISCIDSNKFVIYDKKKKLRFVYTEKGIENMNTIHNIDINIVDKNKYIKLTENLISDLIFEQYSLF